MLSPWGLSHTCHVSFPVRAARPPHLSPRLSAVADRVLAGEPMVDVGTDHGLLPQFLLLSGRVPRALGFDLREGPLRGALRSAEALGLNEEAGFVARRSDGLAALRPGEATTVTLAGLGGGLIARILAAAPAHVHGADGPRRIVASPNLEPERTRAWAMCGGWTLVHEALIEDRGQVYPVLTLERSSGAAPDWSDLDLRFGPLLRRERPAVFLRWLGAELRRVERALALAAPRARPEAMAALTAEQNTLILELG